MNAMVEEFPLKFEGSTVTNFPWIWIAIAMDPYDVFSTSRRFKARGEVAAKSNEIRDPMAR
jgi:hypothetical protein